nr:glycosyl hydrolase [Candidatus Sigynarchaeota archaeon]
MVQMEQKYKSLDKIFKDPPNEFRMMPFWFWNHEMVEKEVTRQVKDHLVHGIGGEFIHPRHGRLTPYMGQRWLELVEATADKCKELDMPCFLYDEDNWPSGPAGGFITGPYKKENRGKFVVLFDEQEFTGTHRVEYDLDYKNLSPEAEFIAAVAVPNPDAYPDFSAVIDKQRDLSDRVKDGKFTWDVPEGKWCVIFFCMLVNSADANLNGYIDILRKETVREFIDFTHEKYAKWFIDRGKKEYLGTVVPGIFTDEPSMAHMEANKAYMFPWITFTPDMPKRFKEMFGYSFNEVLVSLFHETGAISAKHRCHYWACAVDLYVNAFYKQIYDCCDKYHMRATGHVNSEGVFPSNIKNHGDFFKVFQYMHYGGVDQLTEDVRPDHIEDIWNLTKEPYTGMAREMLTASKLASSAAHLLGKPRVLVEAYGTSSWDITMASAKRVTDFLIATGCDLFVPHSFNISEDGYRKGDHPAAFNYQPYYSHWKKVADHCGRLCAILNAHSGTLKADVLMLYPAKSFHAEMVPTTSAMAEMIGNYITHNADCIFRQQIDYEIANEEMIRGGAIVGNQIKIRDETFKVLLLGATTCMNIEFAKFVKNFYDAGGKILATYSLAYKEENTGESTEVASIFKGIFGIDPKGLADDIAAGKITDFEAVESKNKAGGHAILIKAPSKVPYSGPYYPLFEQSCRKLLPLDKRDTIAFKDEKKQSHAAYVMVKHKSIDGKEFYFVANTGRDASYAGVKMLLGVVPSKVESWNTLTGEISAVDAFGIENGKVAMTLDFPPNQSYLFVVTPAKEAKSKEAAKVTKPAIAKAIDLGNTWSCKLNAPNGAMLYQDWHSSYKVEAGRAWGYVQFRTFTHEFVVKDVAAIKPVKVVIEGLVGDYGWCKTTTDVLIGGD